MKFNKQKVFENMGSAMALAYEGKSPVMDLSKGSLEFKEPKTLNEASLLSASVIGVLASIFAIKNSINFLQGKKSVFDLDENYESRVRSREKYLFKMKKERLKRIAMYKKPSSIKGYKKRNFSIEKIKDIKC